jgi:hypothetical protein
VTVLSKCLNFVLLIVTYVKSVFTWPGREHFLSAGAAFMPASAVTLLCLLFNGFSLLRSYTALKPGQEGVLICSMWVMGVCGFLAVRASGEYVRSGEVNKKDQMQ